MMMTTTLRIHSTSGLLADGTGGQQLQQVQQGQRQLLQQEQNREKQQHQKEEKEKSAATPIVSRDELVSQ